MKKRDGHREKFWKHHDKDDYVCPWCDRDRSEVDEFQVHHKDKNTRNGDLDNLVAICRECHWEHHDIVPGKREGQWQERFFNEYNSDRNPLKYL